MAENTAAKTGKKVSKKALAKSFRNWYYGNLTCFSQEHMQTFGYLVSMLPIVEDLYEKKEEQSPALNNYTGIFNTEPQIGAMIVGPSALRRPALTARPSTTRPSTASAPASWARWPASATP